MITLNERSFHALVDDHIAWICIQDRCLERDYIILCLQDLRANNYPDKQFRDDVKEFLGLDPKLYRDRKRRGKLRTVIQDHLKGRNP